MTRWLLLLLGTLCLPASSLAGARFDLPLDGWCRPGRFFPLRVSPDAAGQLINLPGCIPANVSAPGIVPMLLIDSPVSPLRLASDAQAIVASTIGSVDLGSLWPDRSIVTFYISASDLRQPLAWESADAIVVDGGDLPLLGSDFADKFAAAGIRIVVRSTTVPPGGLEWKRTGEFWMLTTRPRGPASHFSESAYRPALSWHPGWSSLARTRFVLLAGAFSIVVLALGLLRPRMAVPLIVLFSAAIVAGLIVAQLRVSPIASVLGRIAVSAPPIQQIDTWQYFSSPKACALSVPLGRSWPYFESPDHAQLLRPVLRQDATGQCAIELTLIAKTTLATRRTTIEPAGKSLGPVVPGSKLNSPLVPLARSYAAGALVVAGQSPDGSDARWPTVVLQAP